MKRTATSISALRKPRVSTTRTLVTLTECWLNWDDPPVVDLPPIDNKVVPRGMRIITPGLPKKAKLKDGQVTLTQLTEDEELSTAPELHTDSIPSLSGTPVGFSPGVSVGSSLGTPVGSSPGVSSKSTPSSPPFKGRPPLVENDSLVVLLKELQESLAVLMEQIETVNSWFGENAFDQKSWVENDLPAAIVAVEDCPAVVSVMGRRDMMRFLPEITSEGTFVLIKHLSVHHGFKIHVDIDLNSVNAVFKLQHHRTNFGTLLYEYGTGVEVDGSVFDDEVH